VILVLMMSGQRAVTAANIDPLLPLHLAH